MVTELYRVVYTGQLRLGTTRPEAMAAFCERFKVSEEKARKVMAATRDLTLKKNLERAKAERYLQALEAIGMIVRMEPMVQPSRLEEATLVPIETADQAIADEPKKASHIEEAETGGGRKSGHARQTESSFSTSSPYTTSQEESEPGTLSDPIARPASHGWLWIKRGFWHFSQNPLAWIITLVLWIILSVVLSRLPFVGSLIQMLLSPVILAGFVLGCAAQEQGKDFEVSHLLAGFSSNSGQLVLVGLLYLLGLIGIGVIMSMLGWGVLLGMLSGVDAMQHVTFDTLQSAMGVGTVLLMLLLLLGLLTPLIMAYWFAPALIAMEGMSALNAMKASFAGCMKNMLSFLVYGLVGLVMLFVGMIPFGLGLFVVLPVLIASVYPSYRDIYYR